MKANKTSRKKRPFLSKEEIGKGKIKNRIFCPDAHKPKHVFETKKEVELFLKYNRESFGDKKPERYYYCMACSGYHITSKKF